MTGAWIIGEADNTSKTIQTVTHSYINSFSEDSIALLAISDNLSVTS